MPIATVGEDEMMTPSTEASGACDPYPVATAQEVSARRPDLAAHDAIAAVLTCDPSLTADEVIEVLDEAAEDYAAELAAERQMDRE